MNPNHDPANGQFTTSGQAGATAPRTGPEHSQRHRAAIAAGEDPREGDVHLNDRRARPAPLKPAELQELRKHADGGIVTNDDADRRDLGLHPFGRSAGPHLITAPGASIGGARLGGSNVDQLHGRMVHQHHTSLVREANAKGTNKAGSPTVPGIPDATRPGMSPGFGQAPTRPARRGK